MDKWRGIIVHHSHTEDSGTKSWDAIKRYHIDVNGWRDIGYHFGIERVDDDIRIFQGRSLNDTGAHCQGFNADHIGICLVGNFDREEPSQEKLQALFRLVRGLMTIYHIEPHMVHQHNQYAPKTCPGSKFNWSKFQTMLVNSWG